MKGESSRFGRLGICADWGRVGLSRARFIRLPLPKSEARRSNPPLRKPRRHSKQRQTPPSPLQLPPVLPVPHPVPPPPVNPSPVAPPTPVLPLNPLPRLVWDRPTRSLFQGCRSWGWVRRLRVRSLGLRGQGVEREGLWMMIR